MLSQVVPGWVNRRIKLGSHKERIINGAEGTGKQLVIPHDRLLTLDWHGI